MVAHAIETFGRLDYAVNNAGIEGKFAAVTDLPSRNGSRSRHEPEGHVSVFAVRGASHACWRAWRCDRQRRFRKLFSRLPHWLSVRRLQTRTNRVDYERFRGAAPRGIRVNLVCPGFIDTPMHHRGRSMVGDDLYDKVLIPRVHTRRAGRPDEIAQNNRLPVLGRG